MNACKSITNLVMFLITNEKVSSTTTQNKSGTNNTLVMLNDIRMLKNKLRGDLNEQQRIIHQHLS
jgi:hypothetical protein